MIGKSEGPTCITALSSVLRVALMADKKGLVMRASDKEFGFPFT